MLSPRQQQDQALLMEGAAYNAIDDALLEFGFPMGPLQMGDLAGLDIGTGALAHASRRAIERDLAPSNAITITYL